MIHLGIISATRQLDTELANHIGLGVTALCIVSQIITQMDTTTVMKNPALKYARLIGSEQIVQTFAKHKTILLDTIVATKQLVQKSAIQIGMDRNVPHIVWSQMTQL